MAIDNHIIEVTTLPCCSVRFSTTCLSCVLLLTHLCVAPSTAQDHPGIPAGCSSDPALTAALHEAVAGAGLDSTFSTEDGPEQISFAVIDLTTTPPRYGDLHGMVFIYPASVYKLYVALEVLHQVSSGVYALYDTVVVRSPNDVDRSREIPDDPRPLLHDGDTVTVNYLLDLMITRSDNTAANCLIDRAGRKGINRTVHAFGWNGSEVTRKFLSRRFEDPGYDTIRGTETCALHLADLMTRAWQRTLVNPWVSMQMLALLGRQLDRGKLAPGLPGTAMFYHKTGWYGDWTNDVGIVDDGEVRYVIACLLPVREELATERMRILSERVYGIMKSRLAANRKQ